MKRLLPSIVALVSLSAIAPGAAQDRPVIAVRTSAVLLDVIVRDRNGAVRDLDPSHFEVFEDGVKQTVTSVRVVDRGEAAASSQPAPAGAGAPAAAPSSGDTSREISPAVVAFVFDRMSTEGRRLAHKAALTYTARADNVADFAAVFAIDLALQTIQPFTTDRAALRAGIDRAGALASTRFASDRPEARERTVAAEDARRQLEALGASGGGNASSVQARAGALSMELRFQEMQSRILRMFEALERDQQGFASTNGLLALLNALQSIPGRKTVVFFSEGLSIPAAVQAQFRSVVDSANRASVAVYAMDAGGLRTENVTDETRKEIMQSADVRLRQDAAGVLSSADAPLTKVLERSEDLLRLNPQSGLGQLADETGGFLIRDTNDATQGFRRISDDMRFHYVLSYTPTNETYDGRFRSISVKVLRSGLDVRTRKGYFAVKPEDTMPVRAYEAPALAHLDRTPRAAAFPLRAAALSFADARRPGLASLFVEIPGSLLTYAPLPAGKGHHAEFVVLVRVKDQVGRVVNRVSQQYDVTVAADRLEARRRGDVLFYREIQIPPGRYTAEAVAYDALADKASVRTAAFEMPAADAASLRLSSLFLIKRVEKLPPAEQGGDSPLIYGETMLYPNLGEPLAKSTTSTLGFFVNVYGAKSAPKATLDLMKSGTSLGAIDADLPKADASGRIQYAGSLPLQAFAAGAYTLKVTVTEGSNSVSRTIDFTVVE